MMSSAEERLLEAKRLEDQARELRNGVQVEQLQVLSLGIAGCQEILSSRISDESYRWDEVESYLCDALETVESWISSL